MSWNAAPVEVRVLAESVLTEKQLAAFKLELAGLSVRAIGRHLDVARSTATDRLESAHSALRKAGVRQDEFGRWSLAAAA